MLSQHRHESGGVRFGYEDCERQDGGAVATFGLLVRNCCETDSRYVQALRTEFVSALARAGTQKLRRGFWDRQYAGNQQSCMLTADLPVSEAKLKRKANGRRVQV